MYGQYGHLRLDSSLYIDPNRNPNRYSKSLFESQQLYTSFNLNSNHNFKPKLNTYILQS